MATTQAKPHVVVLGCNFSGLTTARQIRKWCGDAVRITVLDRKTELLFVPNIPLEVMENRDPAQSLLLPVVDILAADGTEFIPAEVNEIDLDGAKVHYTPSERPGGASESIGFDYLVLALGARLAYDRIEGFGEYGQTVSDTYYGNRLRKYLHEGGYKGGPVAIGSARFHQGTTDRPDWLKTVYGACEGPPLELSLSFGSWLGDHKMGGPEKVTVFSPGDVLAEDAGEEIAKEFHEMATQMGYTILESTKDVKRVTADGIEFESGDSLEAEISIIFPDWVAHDVIAELPITDDMGFVVTDLKMHAKGHANVFAAGDCVGMTAPKLGAHGHMQANILARQIAHEVGRASDDDAAMEFDPEIICMGTMGHDKAFYVHSNAWYGGDISVFKMGYMYFMMKLAFKEMYFRSGGNPPSWGVPLTEFVAEKL